MREDEGEDEDEDEDDRANAMGSESDESGDSESHGEASGSASSSEGFDDDAFVVDEEESEEEDEDEDDSEEEEEEESEEEDALERPPSNQMMGMSRAFQSLVGDGEEATEMLPKSRKQLVDGLEARVEEKERRANKRAKIELKHRGHVKPQPRGQNIESDMLERRLHNTATKGVVRLFKAVCKAQEDAEKAKTMRRKDVLISKSKFLEELRGSTKSTDAEETTNKASFLRDDFMLGGNKMKDWEKEQEVAPRDLEYEEGDDDVF